LYHFRLNENTYLHKKRKKEKKNSIVSHSEDNYCLANQNVNFQVDT